ncbi:hypothetical protein EAS61_40065 [Bradyrhizobium zhanjiangense]|uniref:Uncharacterized protein n=1 Tax=Bradyrhizobium zhanjiangense TaxID=1325107 RepID=A0A4Q0Q5J3_9BRAD|nr:hypothetical protein EAS61_40065 [Bradyrhizobium zhanjiangense]
MLEFITRAIRRRRAERYIRAFPDDEPAAMVVVVALELRAKSPREATEMFARRPLSDAERAPISARWERTWHGIK